MKQLFHHKIGTMSIVINERIKKYILTYKKISQGNLNILYFSA